MSFMEIYRDKRRTAEEAIKIVKNGDTIVMPTGPAEPPRLITALSEKRRNFMDVKVAQILPLKKSGYFDPETTQHIRHMSYFFGPASRPGGQEGWVDYLPSHFSELPTLIKRGLTPVDVVFTLASPMDEHGFFSLGLAPAYTMAAIDRARAVVIETNPNVPFSRGKCHVHISQVAAIVEGNEPIPEVGLAAIGELPPKFRLPKVT